MDTKPIIQLDLRTQVMFERLLKESPPHRDRRYALMKLLVDEKSPLPPEQLNEAIGAFYKLAYERRTTEQFRRIFGVKPYPWLLDQFSLSFRTAVVSETRVYKAASSFRHLIRNTIDVPDAISSVDLIHLVIHRITRPRIDQIATGIELSTVSRRWRDVSFFRFGSGYESFFDELDKAIEDSEISGLEQAGSSINFFKTDSPAPLVADPEITQTDLDWFKNILLAFEQNQRPPLYPLARGPKIPITLRIERLVREAHRRFPFRHGPLEDAVIRSCRFYLDALKQDQTNDRKTA